VERCCWNAAQDGAVVAAMEKNRASSGCLLTEKAK